MPVRRNCTMRLMITFRGDESVAPIDDYFTTHRGWKVLDKAELATDEAVTLSAAGKGPVNIERTGTSLRAMWIVDAASREAATAIARDAPGGDGVLEIRESFTPQDFGAPPDAPPFMPPVARQPELHRYIAFVEPTR